MVDTAGRVLTATLAGDIGGALGIALIRFPSLRLHSLVWFAAGAMLSISLLDMLPESSEVLGIGLVAISAGLGAAFTWTTTRPTGIACPACAIDATKPEARAVWLIMAALAVHCFFDGLGFAGADQLHGHADTGLFLGLTGHKIPEGLAMTLLLVGAGFRRTASVLWACAVEGFTLLGGALGMVATRVVSPSAIAASVAFVAGGFVYLLLGSILSARRSTALETWTRAGATAAGFGSTALFLWIGH